MNCNDLENILDGIALQEIDAAQRAEIEQHAQACVDCSEQWRAHLLVASVPVPSTPQDLNARVAAALQTQITSSGPARRRPLIIGSIAIAAVAAAAAISLQPDNPSFERAQVVSEAAPSTDPSASVTTGTPESQNTDNEVPGPATSPSAPTADLRQGNLETAALDPNSIAVVIVTDHTTNPVEREEFESCQAEILRQLGDLRGINVIADQRISAFEGSGLANNQIALQLGAGKLLNIIVDATPFFEDRACWVEFRDVAQNRQLTGLGRVLGPGEGDDQWELFAGSVVARISDAMITDTDALLAEVKAAILDTRRSDTERVRELSRLPRRLRTREALFDSGIIAALSQIAVSSTDPGAREGALIGMRGLEEPSLVEPLIYALNNDTSDSVRRAAAYSLHEYLEIPRVRSALERARAEQTARADDPACCIQTVSEAASRALLSDAELHASTTDIILNENLADRERLQPLLTSPDGRGLDLEITSQIAQSIFTIGSDSDDSLTRSQAWNALSRAEPNPNFAQTLLEDLNNNGDPNVRSSAAAALMRYIELPGVRTQLERASRNDEAPSARLLLQRLLAEIP